MSDIESLLNEITKKTEIILEYRGIKIVDQQTALLLKLIEKYGSILKASGRIGVSYSKAWDIITRIEKTLGIRIVEKRRGGISGGGTRLTSSGLKLLRYYEKIQKSQIRSNNLKDSNEELPDLIVMGSHDLLLERLLYYMENKHHLKIQKEWIGSCGGILAILLEESDIAGIHLLDPITNQYNKNILERYGLTTIATLMRGYDREIVLAYNPYYSYGNLNEILEDIVKGKLRIVNRNPGSGTRILLETLIDKYAKENNINIDYSKIKGYQIGVRTHREVAEYVSSGKAEAGLTLRHLAEAYGLKYIIVAREQYDFVVQKNHLNKYPVKLFIKNLREKTFELKNGLRGYHIPSNIGEKIE